jgi:ADP-ribosylglycohydrolase
MQPVALDDTMQQRLARARLSLEGLSVGDAFGERFFANPLVVDSWLESRSLPAVPWTWTDDTAMALSIVEVLESEGMVDRDALAWAFARRYASDPSRGYGRTAQGILRRIGLGEDWRRVARDVFDGQGSCGNGSAMRVAPVGAYFADDLARVVQEASASAEPTHSHPEGRAGAVAVAVAAAIAARMSAGNLPRDPRVLLGEALRLTPGGETRSGIEVASRIAFDCDARTVASAVGNGSRVIAQDTVPLCLWCAARHLDDFQAAMWTTVSALGDRDTTCAIVGGIVALSASGNAIPAQWRMAREPLG